MPERITVAIRRLPHGAGLPLPDYATAGSAGVDLMAAIGTPRLLAPGARGAVPTGIAIALPPGFEAQIRPRSGLARQHGIGIVNAPGTVDSDYRGEIEVLLINLGDAAFTVEPAMRIAQMVIAPVARADWREAAALDPSGRGAGGFGSTGTAARPA
ncbi:MAG: dUTP diphosphatase [Rhodospirillaceae bacterium]|nr:dUTP diphosphatase [Rhodospirillaceae bacterium]